MYDKDIRSALKNELLQLLDDVSLFDELPICRSGYADVAAVNCALWGFEIKSDHDTLNRLPMQIQNYDMTFDYSVVVTTKQHLKHVRSLIPPKWGIILAESREGTVTLRHIRKPRKNSNACKLTQIQLVWKNEARRILRRLNIQVPSNALVSEVWRQLQKVDSEKLAPLIRDQLKARGGIGFAQPHIQDGG